MKKKIQVIICILTVLLAAAFTGCGTRLSRANADTGKAAVNAVDQFLDGNLSATSALNTLESCYDSVTDEDGSNSTYLRACISNASTAVFEHAIVQTSGMDYGDANVVDKRNDLAEFLGIAKR